MRRLVTLSLSLSLLGGLSCRSSSSLEPGNDQFCTLMAVAAVNVRVLDSVSGLGLPFSQLWARARDGTFMDSSFVMQTLATDAPKNFALAYERAGTYDITVKAAGYREWRKTGVAVARDECHVVPVQLTARLQR